MKFAHTIEIRVFAKGQKEDIKKGLLEIVQLDLEKEKIALKDHTVTGFEEEKINIYSVLLVKQTHTNAFLKRLLKELSVEDKQKLKDQKESRLDNELNFFLRLDKQVFLKEKHFKLTEGGDCYHIKMAIAAYPSTREQALKTIDALLDNKA